jgi:hypothetical protein
MLSTKDLLNDLAQSLVIKGKYINIDEALCGIAISAVRDKISHYRRRIKRLEHKYNADFKTFTDRLKGKATLIEEDDWLAWHSAQNMEADWKKIYGELLNEDKH